MARITMMIIKLIGLLLILTLSLWTVLLQPAPWMTFDHLPEPVRPYRPIIVALLNDWMKEIDFPSLSDAKNLIYWAQVTTGLTDLDDDAERTFMRGLTRLCKSMARESNLTFVGKGLVRAQLHMTIENRLKLVEWRRKHHLPTIPAATASNNDKDFGPVFILGMPRSGSTFLHNLLSLDETTFRAPRQWEIIDPVPPIGDGTEHGLTPWDTARRRIRIGMNEIGTAVFRFLTPNLVGVHPISSLNAEECMPIMGLNMLTYYFQTIMNVPSYQQWLMDRPDQTKALEWHLKYLQVMNTSKVWLLKAPWHMNHLESIFKVYPRARIVVTHREPSSMLSSLSSLIARLHSLVSDDVNLKQLGESTLRTWEVIVDRFVRQRRAIKSSPLAKQILDLPHSALSDHPMQAAEKVYAFLGIPLSERRRQLMVDWLAKDTALGKKGAAKKHEYRPEWFGLEESHARSKAFHEYVKEYL